MSDNTPELLNIILATLLLKEREKSSYYEQRLKYEESKGVRV
jgi:hypothetical protein